MTPLFEEQIGDGPVIIDVPHAGTRVLPEMERTLTDAARPLPDTDWHVEKLVSFASGPGVTILAATHSRYVIDLNRDPGGIALYPGANNTELCPTTTFDEAPIYHDGCALDAAQIETRRAVCWEPYHARLRELIRRTRERHGYAILLDAHSIRSHVPRFFAGRLPDLNLGTASGVSCAPEVEQAAYAVLSESGMSHVLNGRFKGGYITRRYGVPSEGVHALQLETAQACYMNEMPPYPWDAQRAGSMIAVLRRLIETLQGLRL